MGGGDSVGSAQLESPKDSEPARGSGSCSRPAAGLRPRDGCGPPGATPAAAPGDAPAAAAAVAAAVAAGPAGGLPRFGR